MPISEVLASTAGLASASSMLLAYHGLDLQFTESEPLSYEQISAKFDAPINTVASKIHRAKYALRQALTSVVDQEVIKINNLEKSEAA